MLDVLIRFKKSRKGQDIIDNIVALGIFTIAFLYVVYLSVNTITPLIETEEYIDVELRAFTSIERIISDPVYGLVSKDHVLSYDKLVEFVAKENTSKYPFCPLSSSQNSYVNLLEQLNLLDIPNNQAKYDLQLVITSNYVTINTLANVTNIDINDYNFTLPTGYLVSDLPLYNTERAYLGEKFYEFLVVKGNKGQDYNRVYIDVNLNRNFQDEVDNGFYGYIAGVPRSGFGADQNFSLESKKYLITDITSNGQSLDILNIDSSDVTLGKRRSYSDIVLVISRDVLLDKFGELNSKKIFMIMWRGNRFPC